MAAPKLGDVLVKQGLLRTDQLELALKEQQRSGGTLTPILVSKGFLSEAQILKALERHYQIPAVDLNSFQIDSAAANLIPQNLCAKHSIIGIQKKDNTLVVAFADPSNIFLKEDLRFITRCKIQSVVASEVAIQSSIERILGISVAKLSQTVENIDGAVQQSVDAADVKVADIQQGDEQTIVKYVNAVLADALRKKASDIHFEPYEKRFRVRFRVDGNMIEIGAPPQVLGPAIVSRIKIMSKLDIAERRRPQDGRIKIRVQDGRDIDFRVSTLPTLWGEKVVLRILDKTSLQVDMTKLGFEEDDLKIFRSAIHLPQGMVLITGPTGSGKTTTIYSALNELNQPDVNICTAEDPVEFNLEGINQVNMNPEIDLTFAAALRSFLRQDPDVVMVGEIRDLETAEISFKAASTGHMVVSTLHTNDAPSTIMRLIDMGVPPYIITSTLNLVVAQRLVGRVCESCKVAVTPEAQTLLNLGVDQKELVEYKQIFKGKGCSACNNTGYRGRLAIFELMSMSENMKNAILKNSSTMELRKIARLEGMRTLRRSALLKLKRGQTTVEEVITSSVKDA